MIGGFGSAPFQLGGARPLVASIYDALRDGLPSALRGEPDSVTDLDTLVQANMISTVWETEERRVSNTNPSTASEMLWDWCKRFQINPDSFTSISDLQRYLAFGERRDFRTLTRAVFAQACHLCLGKVYGDLDRTRFFYHVTWNESSDFDDLDSPANTYWYGNPTAGPSGETWTTNRALVDLLILRLPNESDEDVIRLIKERLAPMLEWLLPAWASYTWTIQEWTPETYDAGQPSRIPKKYGGLDLIAGRAPDLVIWGADLSADFPANTIAPYVDKTGDLTVTAATGFTDEQIVRTYWRVNDGATSAISIEGSSSSAKTGLLVSTSYAGNDVPLGNVQLTVGFLYRALASNSTRELFWAGEIGNASGYLMVTKGVSNQIGLRIGSGAVTNIGTLPMAAGDLGFFVASVRQNGTNTELSCMIHKLGDALGSPTVSGLISLPSSTEISRIDSIGLGCNGSNGSGGSSRPFRMVTPMMFLFESWGASQAEMSAMIAHVVNTKNFV